MRRMKTVREMAAVTAALSITVASVAFAGAPTLTRYRHASGAQLTEKNDIMKNGALAQADFATAGLSGRALFGPNMSSVFALGACTVHLSSHADRNGMDDGWMVRASAKGRKPCPGVPDGAYLPRK